MGAFGDLQADIEGLHGPAQRLGRPQAAGLDEGLESRRLSAEAAVQVDDQRSQLRIGRHRRRQHASEFHGRRRVLLRLLRQHRPDHRRRAVALAGGGQQLQRGNQLIRRRRLPCRSHPDGLDGIELAFADQGLHFLHVHQTTSPERRSRHGALCAYGRAEEL